jgi:hypothetical protein
MGKAEIISGGASGLYQIRLIYDRTRADAEITALEAENTAIDTAMPDKQQAVTDAQNALFSALDVQSATIANPDSTLDDKQRAADAVSKARIVLASAKQTVAFLALRKAANSRRIAFVDQHVPTSENLAAWCADYNEGLTGIVGTIETSRERGGQVPVIRPGGADGDQAGHLVARDGTHQPVMAATPAAAFFNYALLPGADRHVPLYRAATISEIDTTTDTCTVELIPVAVGHQGISTTDLAPINNVPVQYMTCNAAAFAPDDLVIVEFSGGWDTATVIGFVSHPRPCEGGLWLRITINGNLCQRGGQQIVLRYQTTGGATVTTPARIIPAVGAPLAVDGLISVPEANESLAGPFDLTDWDGSLVEVLLHRERKNDNTGVDFRLETATAGTETVRGMNVLYDYYTHVNDSYAEANIVVNQEDYILWATRAAGDDACFDLVLYRKLYFGGNGVNTIIAAPNPASDEWAQQTSGSWRRFFRTGNYKRLNYYPIGELTLAMIEGAPAGSVMDLLTGEMLGGQTIVDVACSATFMAVLYDMPAAHPYNFLKGTYLGTQHRIIYGATPAEDTLETIYDSEREPWQDLRTPLPEHVFMSEGCTQEINSVYGYNRIRIPENGSVGLVINYSRGAGSGFYVVVEIDQDTPVPTHAITSVGSTGMWLGEQTVYPVLRNTGPKANRPDSVWCFELYFAQLDGLTMSCSIRFPEGAVTTWAQPVRLTGYSALFCTPMAVPFTTAAYRSVVRVDGERTDNVSLADALLRARKVYPYGRAVSSPESFAPFYSLLPECRPRVVIDGGSINNIAVPYHAEFEKQYTKADLPLILFDEATGAVTGPAVSIVEAEENLLDVLDGQGELDQDFSQTINWTYNASGVAIDVAGYL